MQGGQVVVEGLVNRLTAAACRCEPRMQDLLGWLAERRLPHLLSGSGSACFALGHQPAPPGMAALWTRALGRDAALAEQEDAAG
jgi:4-diphosphocytidyl-2C-methyl-D-erythritol kinase